jgi:hypothetical protein
LTRATSLMISLSVISSSSVAAGTPVARRSVSTSAAKPTSRRSNIVMLTPGTSSMSAARQRATSSRAARRT